MGCNGVHTYLKVCLLEAHVSPWDTGDCLCALCVLSVSSDLMHTDTSVLNRFTMHSR